MGGKHKRQWVLTKRGRAVKSAIENIELAVLFYVIYCWIAVNFISQGG